MKTENAPNTPGAGFKAIAKQYRRMARALRVIHTWASCHYDLGSLDPEDTINLCEKALKRFRK